MEPEFNLNNESRQLVRNLAEQLSAWAATGCGCDDIIYFSKLQGLVQEAAVRLSDEEVDYLVYLTDVALEPEVEPGDCDACSQPIGSIQALINARNYDGRALCSRCLGDALY